MTEIGEEAESVVTNSESLAKAIENANCETCKEVDAAVSEEVRRQSWTTAHMQFEQHMKEEDEVRANWLSGELGEGRMFSDTCGDKHAWDRSHACCNQQCNDVLNALQAFPFSAWDDVAGTKVDPAGVIKARKI